MKLFQADNLTDDKITYREIDHTQVPFEAILKAYFEEYSIKSVTQLNGTEINSNNYRLTIDIQGRERVVLLRRYRNLSDKEQIDFYLSVVKKMEGGVPVSRALETLSGELSLAVKDGIYSLFDFIEADHFKPIEQSYTSVAKAVALMHRALQGLAEGEVNFIEQKSVNQGNAYFNKIKECSTLDLIQIKEIIEAKSERNDADKEVLEKMPLLLDAVREVEEGKAIFAMLSRQIIHSDLHPHNILIKDEEVRAIVDFDSLRVGYKIFDVAFALYRFGKQFIVASQDTEQCVKLAKMFLEAYNTANSLSKEEIDEAPVVLKEDTLRRMLFVLRGVYQEGNLTWAKDIFKLLAAVEEINFFWPEKI